MWTPMRAKLRADLLELTKEQKRMATRRTTESARSNQPPTTTEQPTEKRPARKGATQDNAPAPAAAAAPAMEVDVSPDARRAMIAEAAYLRAERRGFVPGYELEDWIAAESEVDTLLQAEKPRRPQ